MTAKQFEDEDMDKMHVLYFKSELIRTFDSKKSMYIYKFEQ